MNLIEAQSLVKIFSEDKKMNSPVEVRIIDLASEVGELSKEVLKGIKYGNKEFEKTRNGKVKLAMCCFL